MENPERPRHHASLLHQRLQLEASPDVLPKILPSATTLFQRNCIN